MIQSPLASLTNQPTATARKKCLVLQQSIAVETKSPIISISLSGDSPRNSSSHSPVWPAVNLPLKVILDSTWTQLTDPAAHPFLNWPLVQSHNGNFASGFDHHDQQTNIIPSSFISESYLDFTTFYDGGRKLKKTQ